MELKRRAIGIIGLGQMGSGIAANLVRAGYSVTGYDLKADSISKLVGAGGRSAKSGQEIVAHCDVVLTCVEGRDSVSLADTVLLPNARPGQIFIDHSTVPAPETRRIGAAFVSATCGYLDAPISGGKGGAEAGTLRIFVGGDKATAAQCWPLFEVIGNPEKIVYCGPMGMGQIAKVVQQLTTRFADVARIEVMSFGLRAGLDLETLMRALDVSIDSRDPYSRLCRGVQDGSIGRFSYEYAEWGYYLEEAKALGFRMPMLEAMYEFCKDGEKVTGDALRRPEPSIWNELMRSPGSEVKENGET
jgi:3-hydroxyisobutyrate dehydrogenase-like beta-hydroxyacid dehydrogenase